LGLGTGGRAGCASGSTNSQGLERDGGSAGFQHRAATASPVETDKAILITINQLYSSDLTARELLEATRGIWVVDPERAGRAELAMAVYQGVVKEVYRIRGWYRAGTLGYRTRDTRGFRRSGRWEFDGDVAPDVRGLYVGKSIRRHQGKSRQNPIRYVNVQPALARLAVMRSPRRLMSASSRGPSLAAPANLRSSTASESSNAGLAPRSAANAARRRTGQACRFHDPSTGWRCPTPAEPEARSRGAPAKPS
jgi:hypothetical protein